VRGSRAGNGGGGRSRLRRILLLRALASVITATPPITIPRQRKHSKSRGL
jgi:hypothetical protein